MATTSKKPATGAANEAKPAAPTRSSAADLIRNLEALHSWLWHRL